MTASNQDHASAASPRRARPRLMVGHSTLAARDLEALHRFYCDALGFEVTNRGPVGEEGLELVFLSQDATAHHQIAMVKGASTPPSDFVMIDHLAFRTQSLDDLRAIRSNLHAAGIVDILHIDHGNAWSLYFKDPEGNGVECYVDTPFHVAQPYAGTFDLDAPDEQILRATRERIEGAPEFELMKDWQARFDRRLNDR
ncbi:MAG: VOC family protein [Steroidobacteraceae bacterium]|nr:VOC family protein [Nevskiaceae bacterium]MCP5472497.1 VOC family protein [Nevskiaceae bacterium]